mmetsp:Transcript_21656/g.60298  ORF Transcript_21656/g.60298 Transcript_21656/m.60298 type:complete len:108 (-) Transcript_21656:1668-1991(-)
MASLIHSLLQSLIHGCVCVCVCAFRMEHHPLATCIHKPRKKAARTGVSQLGSAVNRNRAEYTSNDTRRLDQPCSYSYFTARGLGCSKDCEAFVTIQFCAYDCEYGCL